MTTRSFLSNVDLFKNLTPAQLSLLENKITERRYAKGDSIFLEGDPATHVWFVKEGHVKAVVHSADGRDQTLCMIGGNKMFGTCCCLGGGRYACNSVAETDTAVITLALDDFTALLDKNPELSKTLAIELSQRLRHAKKDQLFSQEPVEKRILRALIGLVEEFGTTIPLTRREIAEMVGTTVETCIRTFGRLEAEGLVVSARGKITVKDPQTLKEYQEND